MNPMYPSYPRGYAPQSQYYSHQYPAMYPAQPQVIRSRRHSDAYNPANYAYDRGRARHPSHHHHSTHDTSRHHRRHSGNRYIVAGPGGTGSAVAYPDAGYNQPMYTPQAPIYVNRHLPKSYSRPPHHRHRSRSKSKSGYSHSHRRSRSKSKSRSRSHAVRTHAPTYVRFPSPPAQECSRSQSGRRHSLDPGFYRASDAGRARLRSSSAGPYGRSDYYQDQFRPTQRLTFGQRLRGLFGMGPLLHSQPRSHFHGAQYMDTRTGREVDKHGKIVYTV